MITWQDRFFAEDKAFHFCGSFTAVCVLHWALWHIMNHYTTIKLMQDRRWTWTLDHMRGVVYVTIFLAGVALEWYQYSHGIDVFSVKDIIWNAAGIAAAWGVMR